MDRLDEGFVFLQSISKLADAHVQAASGRLNRLVWPENINEFFAGDNPPAICDEEFGNGLGLL
jgi:hypothetical protein